jgi:hypothetical protein
MIRMKTIPCLISCLLIPALLSCEAGGGKRAQTVDFGELPPQLLIDGTMTLQASASSGLPVTFVSWDTDIALVRGNTVEFVSAGTVSITASQPGNESFYEAPSVTRTLKILNRDPNKKTQTISFELPEEWSNDNSPLSLVATATSGLPVKFTASDWKAAITEGNQLILYHGTYTYDLMIQITASQEGDSVYNPAENVVRTLHAIGEGTH